MRFFNEVEVLDREELEKIKIRRLRETVNSLYDNVLFYKQKLKDAGFEKGDIKNLDDLKNLPFTMKDDLRENYPFGLFAVPIREIVRLHASSGTTGRPTVVGYTKEDIETWADLVARTIVSSGGNAEDIIQIAYGYGLFTGGLGLHYGGEKLGATVIPVSGGNTKRQIRLMVDFGTTILACTPSYSLNIAETISELEIKAEDIKLKSGIFGAEPWSEDMRKEIEKSLSIKAYDIYGLSEVTGPGVSIECEEQKGLHVFEDCFIPEIIDPVTGDVLPYGSEGELVFTNINKRGLSLLRYRTRDITSLDISPCPCGRTHVRMGRIKGRTDDMLIIRGVNVFPSQVETVLMQIPGLSPHYQLVVDRIDNMDVLEVQVEMSLELFSDEIKKLEEQEARIRNEVDSYLGVGVRVRLMEPKSIERSLGKAVRVIDNRKI